MISVSYIKLIIAFLVALTIALLPLDEALPVSGQNMLAILAFALIVWITEAIDYTASAIIIAALMIFMLGFAPSLDNPETILGTSKALRMTLSGFSNSALALVASAMFIAVAMTITGLDKRIALFTMSKIGASSKSILIGAIAVTIVLSLVVPSATARTACVVPIMMGVIAAFNVDRNSRLAASMMIVIAQSTSIWNVGIQTAAAQNILSLGFINKAFGAENTVSWLDWFLAGAPWSICMSIVLYFVARKLLPPEIEVVKGGVETIKKSLAALGPTTAKEKRLIMISILLLLFWATGGKLHKIDVTSVTLAGLAIMLLPGIGVMSWKDIEKRVQWGTIVMFGVGISLGAALLDTKAASWLANYVVNSFNLRAMSPLMIFAILSGFLIIIHLGFASATALTSALLPIMISLLISLPAELGINTIGMTVLLAFTVSFGFILPINAPQNMVCLGTNTFTLKQFSYVGVVLTLTGYLLLLLFASTWWKVLGLI